MGKKDSLKRDKFEKNESKFHRSKKELTKEDKNILLSFILKKEQEDTIRVSNPSEVHKPIIINNEEMTERLFLLENVSCKYFLYLEEFFICGLSKIEFNLQKNWKKKKEIFIDFSGNAITSLEINKFPILVK